MALKLWRGNQTGHVGDWDWDDAGAAFATSNWTNAAGVGVAKPIAADVAVFASGNQSVTAGLTQAITLAKLIFGPGYEGSIATSAGRLNIGADLVRFASGGEECWLNLTAGTREVWVEDGTQGANMLQLAGTVTLALIFGGLGTVTFANGMALNRLRMAGVQSTQVVIGSSITGIVDVLADAGQVTLASAASGIVEALKSALITVSGAGAIGTMVAKGLGRINYNGSGGATLVQVFGDRAVIDCSDNTNAGPITFTTAEAWRGGTLDLRSGLDNFSVPTLRELGGTVLQHDAAAVTV
jgi:hypothetical protein